MDNKNILIIILLCVVVALATYIITIGMVSHQTPVNQTVNNTTNTTNLTVNKTVEEQIKNNPSRYVSDEKGVYDTVTGKYISGQYQGSSKSEADEYSYWMSVSGGEANNAKDYQNLVDSGYYEKSSPQSSSDGESHSSIEY